METPTVLSGITSSFINTPRLQTHLLTCGAEDGLPILFIHGNVSSNLFWEETMLALPPTYRSLAPDLRGFGHSESKAVDATRGGRDFADDLHSLVEVLGLSAFHLVGWSLGGGVAMQYTLDHPEQVASLTLVAPVSPFGFGGTKDVAGNPVASDYAGSGGGAANPEFVQRLADKDRSSESNLSPRLVMNSFYFKPPFKATPEREEVFVSSMLSTQTGLGNYPGDMTPSPHWPTIAPGSHGLLNAISPQYFNVSHLADLNKKPPILWIRGDNDQIVSDNSFFDLAYLGQLGAVPGWPGAEVAPPQPMIAQTRAVLQRYQANGGHYREVIISSCGHSPHIEHADTFRKLLVEFWRKR